MGFLGNAHPKNAGPVFYVAVGVTVFLLLNVAGLLAAPSKPTLACAWPRRHVRTGCLSVRKPLRSPVLAKDRRAS